MSWGTSTNSSGTLSKPKLPDEIKKTPELNKSVETIMIYGGKGCGKTTAACSAIDETLKSNPDATIFYVCTDNGFDLTSKYYFGQRTEEVMKHIRLYYPAKFRDNKAVPFFTAIAAMFSEIQGLAKPTDWIIVDIADKFWQWAMDIWTEQSAPQNSPTTYMADAAKNVKQFVEMSRMQWNFTKRLDNFATTNILEAAKCNILYIMSSKDLEIEEEDKPKKNIDDIFDLVGSKPAGQGAFVYNFNTVIYVSGLLTKKYFILCDRGFDANYSEKTYGASWFADFKKTRTKTEAKT